MLHERDAHRHARQGPGSTDQSAIRVLEKRKRLGLESKHVSNRGRPTRKPDLHSRACVAATVYQTRLVFAERGGGRAGLAVVDASDHAPEGDGSQRKEDNPVGFDGGFTAQIRCCFRVAVFLFFM